MIRVEPFAVVPNPLLLSLDNAISFLFPRIFGSFDPCHRSHTQHRAAPHHSTNNYNKTTTATATKEKAENTEQRKGKHNIHFLISGRPGRRETYMRVCVRDSGFLPYQEPLSLLDLSLMFHGRILFPSLTISCHQHRVVSSLFLP